MSTSVKNIQVSEIRIPEALDSTIDKDIEQSEMEIAKGEGLLDAREAFRLMREKHGFV